MKALYQYKKVVQLPQIQTVIKRKSPGCRKVRFRRFRISIEEDRGRERERGDRGGRQQSRFLTFSHVSLYVPAMPVCPIATVIILVSLNGTISGYLDLCFVISKQSPKSICTTLPETLSNMRLEGCLSPSPRMYPAMDITPLLLVKLALRGASMRIVSTADVRAM